MAPWDRSFTPGTWSWVNLWGISWNFALTVWSTKKYSTKTSRWHDLSCFPGGKCEDAAERERRNFRSIKFRSRQQIFKNWSLIEKFSSIKDWISNSISTLNQMVLTYFENFQFYDCAKLVRFAFGSLLSCLPVVYLLLQYFLKLYLLTYLKSANTWSRLIYDVLQLRGIV